MSWIFTLLNPATMYPTSQSYKPYNDTSSEDASVHGEDEAFLEKPGAQRRKKSLCSRFLRGFIWVFSPAVISCIFSALTAGMLVLVLIALTQGQPIKSIWKGESAGLLPQKVTYHCGSTPDEARALGCKFDIMSFAWTPPACYDGRLSNEIIQKTGPWIFYLDHEATKPIADNIEALSNEPIVWTEHSYHISHCTYAWERIHKAYLDENNSKLLPSEIASVNHTLHCIGLVNAEQSAKKTVNAIAYMVFDSCTNLNLAM